MRVLLVLFSLFSLPFTRPSFHRKAVFFDELTLITFALKIRLVPRARVDVHGAKKGHSFK